MSSAVTSAALAGDYDFDDDASRVDRDALWSWLSSEAYWARWRNRRVVEQQLNGAWRSVGAYHRGSGAMVGFARAVSDGCSVAYLADVFVDVAHRHCGVGSGLIRTMIDEGPGASFQWMLHTRDAEGLYRRFGFAPPDGRYLERPGSPVPT